MNSRELRAWWDSAEAARELADRAALRITYENARRIHEGWYADADEEGDPFDHYAELRDEDRQAER
jgi:hypothetical protein